MWNSQSYVEQSKVMWNSQMYVEQYQDTETVQIPWKVFKRFVEQLLCDYNQIKLSEDTDS
jgi:hypothetical protein